MWWLWCGIGAVVAGWILFFPLRLEVRLHLGLRGQEYQLELAGCLRGALWKIGRVVRREQLEDGGHAIRAYNAWGRRVYRKAPRPKKNKRSESLAPDKREQKAVSADGYLARLLRRGCLQTLHLRVELGAGDAAATALLLGGIQAVVYGVLTAKLGPSGIPDCALDFQPNYAHTVLLLEGACKVRVALWDVLAAALWRRRRRK